MSKPEAYVINIDGAARGNPGPAGAGAILYDPEGIVRTRLTRYLGETTNNVAEYQALLLGLEEAHRLAVARLKIFADSELLVKQLTGLYRVKSPQTRQIIGTGLGLPIVRSVVEAHRGAIEVESQVGVGSTFRVLLPVVP